MNDNQTQYFTKLSAKSIFSLIKIYFLGVFCTVLVLVFGFIQLFGSIDMGSAPHTGAIPYLIFIYSVRPLASILLVLVLTLSPIIFFIVAQRYVVKKTVYQVIQEKSETLILPLLAQTIQQFQTKHPEFFQSIDSFIIHKIRIIQKIQKDTSQHIWKRKTMAYLLQKIRLDEVDLRDEKSSVADIITLKIKGILENFSPPSKKPIWILILVQWLVFLIVWKTKL